MAPHDLPQTRVRTALRGRNLLRQPLLNKGTAFTLDERRALGLEGLLPSAVSTIEQQVSRAYETLIRNATPLERYVTLASLQDTNETLFYRLLLTHTEKMMPIVYTPTVGEACQKYSRIYRRSRGVWITPDHRGRIADVLAAHSLSQQSSAAAPSAQEVDAPPHPIKDMSFGDVRLIVVTDNERILGLGDQGAGGIGIPIGKLTLYTLGAGIHPSKTLPVSLDVGTDNESLLSDELYIGFRQPRLRGDAYDSLVDEFVRAVKKLFPRALLQWEDFKKATAFELLDRYRNELLCFNDDIQGTAAVALAGVVAACRAKREPMARQRVLIAGGGAAGIGIARQLRDAFRREGIHDEAERLRMVAIVDSKGLLIAQRADEEHKREFAWPAEMADSFGLRGKALADLGAIVEAIRPTILIGTSGQRGVFDERVIRAMAAHTERPVVFPLSNPTSQSEAIPRDVLEWTGGRALCATGSPFDPVAIGGREHTISQANNVYVFPGVGLGALLAQATVVSDSMFTVAANELAASVSDDDLARGALFPPLTDLRRVTARIASAVVREARERGLSKSSSSAHEPADVEGAMWFPAYPEVLPGS